MTITTKDLHPTIGTSRTGMFHAMKGWTFSECGEPSIVPATRKKHNWDLFNRSQTSRFCKHCFPSQEKIEAAKVYYDPKPKPPTAQHTQGPSLQNKIRQNPEVLAAEAASVLAETGMTPRELADAVTFHQNERTQQGKDFFALQALNAELLAALRCWEHWLQTKTGGMDAVNLTRAALTKAEKVHA